MAVCFSMRWIRIRCPFTVDISILRSFKGQTSLRNLPRISKIFLRRTLLCLFLVKKCTPVNFSRIFGTNLRSEKIKAKKQVRKCKLAPKILKKFTEVIFFTKNNHEFFQNCWSQCAPWKNLWNVQQGIAMIFR